MRLLPVLLVMVLDPWIAGCVIVSPGASPDAKVSTVAKRPPLRLNVAVSLDCRPSCTYVGTDLWQARDTIAAAYESSGRFSLTPSDRVDLNAEVRLSIDREDDWLNAESCHGTFGLMPAVWHDRLRMSTTYVSPRGIASRRLEQTAEVSYHCHLLFAPLLPFRSEPDVLNRLVTVLTNRTIEQAEAERVFDAKRAEISSGGL